MKKTTRKTTAKPPATAAGKARAAGKKKSHAPRTPEKRREDAAREREHERRDRLAIKLNSLVRKWAGLLWLAHWTIDVEFAWNGIGARRLIDVPGTADQAEVVVFADCVTAWEYQRATIRFNMPACEQRTDKQNAETVVHELMHVIVGELRERDSKHEERVVTHLTNVVLRFAAIADGERA